jgi:hypothetical protein
LGAISDTVQGLMLHLATDYFLILLAVFLSFCLDIVVDRTSPVLFLVQLRLTAAVVVNEVLLLLLTDPLMNSMMLLHDDRTMNRMLKVYVVMHSK